MKKYLISASVAMATLGLFGFQQLQKKYENIFNQLGLETEEAESYITGNIMGNSTTFPRTKIMAQLALNKRADAIREIGNYVKAYLKTPACLAEYETTRKEMKPELPPNTSIKEDMDWYRKDLKRWETEYPASLNMLVKKRLNDFLELTSSIDYNAKLERRGSKMVFADPALEEKDEFWKACFRSGKPTVDAARAYARQWLSELK